MHGGGAEQVAALLCNHWAASGFEVILMPTFSGRGTCVYKLNHGVRIEFLADRAKLLRKGSLARQRIIEVFSIKSVISSFEKFYLRLIY